MATQSDLRAVVHDEIVNVLRSPEFKKAGAAASTSDVHDAVLGVTRSAEFQQELRDSVLQIVRSDEFRSTVRAAAANG